MSQLAPIFGVFIAKEDMPSKLGGLRHAVFGARRLVQDKDASEISLGGRVLGRSVANCCKSSLLRGTEESLSDWLLWCLISSAAHQPNDRAAQAQFPVPN